MIKIYPGSSQRWKTAALATTSLEQFPVELDCGRWCTAYTLLSPELPVSVFSGDGNDGYGIALVHAAGGELWDNFVQCAAVVDSISAQRSCCACAEQWNCPWKGMDAADSGYCRAACGGGAPSDTCKQLSAGCGVSGWDIRDGKWNQCSNTSLMSGRCELCMHPLWCDDDSSFGYAGRIKTEKDWIDEFLYDRTRARQCKFKPSQREQFIRTTTRYLEVMHERNLFGGLPDVENEVNMYVGPGDGGTAAALMRSLVGLVYIRTQGKPSDLDFLKKLGLHMRTQLGLDVPLFGLSAERVRYVEHWRRGVPTDLLAAPYSLEPIAY